MSFLRVRIGFIRGRINFIQVSIRRMVATIVAKRVPVLVADARARAQCALTTSPRLAKVTRRPPTRFR
jgi:hypothetical protein